MQQPKKLWWLWAPCKPAHIYIYPADAVGNQSKAYKTSNDLLHFSHCVHKLSETNRRGRQKEREKETEEDRRDPTNWWTDSSNSKLKCLSGKLWDLSPARGNYRLVMALFSLTLLPSSKMRSFSLGDVFPSRHAHDKWFSIKGQKTSLCVSVCVCVCLQCALHLSSIIKLIPLSLPLLLLLALLILSAPSLGISSRIICLVFLHFPQFFLNLFNPISSETWRDGSRRERGRQSSAAMGHSMFKLISLLVTWCPKNNHKRQTDTREWERRTEEEREKGAGATDPSSDVWFPLLLFCVQIW